MHGHLVTVEVSVEGFADERVNLDGLTVDEHGLESLNTQTVQSRCAVKQHGVLSNNAFQDVPHDRTTTLHHALGALDVLSNLCLDESLHDKGLKELQRHHLWQATLVQFQLRAHHDDGTTRVVNALSEQVLTESSLLTLQHVRKALQGSTALSLHWTATTTVVEQRVHCFLQHSLFVVHNDVRRLQVQKTLQTIVAVDDSSVQVVEVTRRETSTVELHHRTKVRRNNRNGFQDHGARVIHASTIVVTTVEGLHNGETLQELRHALGGEGLTAILRLNHFAHDLFFHVEVHAIDQLQNCFGTHAAFEVLAVLEFHLAIERLIFDDLTRVQRFKRGKCVLGEFALFHVTSTHTVDFFFTGALQGTKFGFF